ncbi:hypothetical protein KJ877_03475 [bacterium]|nr:hypothetical protein [bacterium]MBU1990570.1 hypothetical protein [bacterium]
MVRRIFVFFAYLFFFLLALMYFTPKLSVYYFLEEQIKPFGVVISRESLTDKGLTLKIEHASISAKSIESANIAEIDIGIFGLYNSAEFQDIKLSSAAGAFVPLKIQNAKIVHSVLDPLHVNAQALGEFGEAAVSFDIMQKAVRLVLKPSALMLRNYQSTLRNLKKSENGEYVYDKNF